MNRVKGTIENRVATNEEMRRARLDNEKQRAEKKQSSITDSSQLSEHGLSPAVAPSLLKISPTFP